MRKVIAYVPVLHEGYRKFFSKYKDADILILGNDVISMFSHLSKEIRQLDPLLIKKAIESWGGVKKIEILDRKLLEKISNEKEKFEIIMPNDEVGRELAEKFFDNNVAFDTLFLRWDKHKIMEERPVEADQKISVDDFDKEIIEKLAIESEKSSDIWRKIGAAVIKGKGILLSSHNTHMPSEHSPWANGDPRNNLHKGIGIEYSSAIHAEASLIAEAAKKGICLDGLSMYVTIFPCPPCAKLIAMSGIKKLYYSGGYSILNQEEILKSKGVEIIYVDIKKA